MRKYAHFSYLSCPLKASVVLEAFVETIRQLHGIPIIISYNRILNFHWKYLD